MESSAPRARDGGPFTVDEVLARVDDGRLELGGIELLEGRLVPMSPQGTEHAALTVVVRRRLERAFGAGAHVRDHSPIPVGTHHLPEPDVLVVLGDPRDYLERHPTPAEIPLVVEIAKTSQARDRRKATAYAAAGFSTYWIIDLVGRTIEVRTRPDPEAGYVELHIVPADGAVTVPAEPIVTIPAADQGP
jgi:Uma2 family endonuclease